MPRSRDNRRVRLKRRRREADRLLARRVTHDGPSVANCILAAQVRAAQRAWDRADLDGQVAMVAKMAERHYERARKNRDHDD